MASPWGPPPPPLAPPPPPPRSSRRGLVVLLAVVTALAVAVTAALVVVLLRGDDEPAARGEDTPAATDAPDDPEETDEAEGPDFEDWLAPARTLRYGPQRYVSPCQVLNLDDAEEIFGDLPPGGQVQEENYDTSPSTGAGPYPDELITRCDYEDLVGLEVTQFVSTGELTRLGLGAASLGAGDAAEVLPHLERYQAAAELTDDAEVKEFVAGLVRAGRATARYDRSYDEKAFRGLRFADVVVPVSPGALQLRFFHRHLAFTIGGYTSLTPDLGAMSDEEVLERLTQLMQAIERVRERVADPQLSQSSAPTITGDSDTYEGTYVLEPCAVLTKDVFRATTGRRANEIVRRSTLPPEDRDAPGTGQTAASEISINNTCERNHETEKADYSATRVGMRLAIRYAPSPEALQESMRIEGFLPLGKKDRKLRTPADFAAFYPFEPGGIQGSYRFTVGSYLLEVSIDVLLSDGDLGGEIIQGQSAVDVHERAIRNLVPALRQHLAAVEAASPTS